MVTVGLLLRLEAKPGKEAEVEQFLRNAQPVVQDEPATTAWFAVTWKMRPREALPPMLKRAE